MKKIITISVVLLYHSISLYAQMQQIEEDSVFTVLLKEVSVKTALKNQTTLLKDFFVANKNATTEHILSRLPEINMIRRGSYGTEPLIRSYNTGQTNLLIDGMRIHGACTDKMDPPSIYIEPQNLQSIQVQTEHGTQMGSSIGGIVNLKLVTPDFQTEKPITATVSSGYQSGANAFFESGVMNYSKGKLAVRGNITFRKAADYKSGGGVIVPYSAYNKVNYSLSAAYLLNETTRIKADVLLDDGWNIGYPALPMDVGYAAARIVAVSIQKNTPNTRWKNTEYKLYGNSVFHTMDDTQRKVNVMHMDMPGHSKTFGAFVSTTYVFKEKNNVQLRADISSTDLNASMTMYQPGQPPMYMLTWPNNRSVQTGFSAIYKTYINNENTITISSRIDQFINSLTSEEARNQLSVLQEPTSFINKFLKNFSLAIEHRLTSNLTFGATLGYAERMPSASELYGFYLFNAFDNYDYIGSTSLKKEAAYKADIKFILAKPKFQMSLLGYVSRIDNYILGIYQPYFSTMTIGASGVKQYQNTSFATLAGVEASMIYKPFVTVQLISTLKYNYGADDSNNPLPLIAPLKNITSVRKQIKRWSIQAETEIASAQNRVSIIARENTTPGYIVVNARVGYNGAIRENTFSVSCGVENVFDKMYKDHLDWKNVYRQGRNLYLVFSFSF